MVKSLRHCPHLGLKQNRAIRFASPTPEHRCYVTGDAQSIPVDQNDFCLSDNHVNCPLYMGLRVPSMPVPETAANPPAPSGGLRGKLAALSPRDRVIYGVLLLVLLLIIGTYVVLALQLLSPQSGEQGSGQQTTPALPAGTSTTTTPTSTPPADSGGAASETSTPIPTTTPTPTSSPTPTHTPAITSTTPPVVATITPTQTVTQSPAASPTPAATPTVFVPPTLALPTATPVVVVPTATPTVFVPPTLALPTATPTAVPPTATPTPFASPTATPQPLRERETLTLYFADPSGTMLVPTHRETTVVSKQVAQAALQELIAGPPAGLQRTVPADVQVLDVSVAGSTLVVNLDRQPGGDMGMQAIALTLTEFPNITEVQFQVNGQNIGRNGSTGPTSRPVINMDNPQGLPTDYASGTRFLPLYFLQNGAYVRITRLVPRTTDIAQATVTELLAGPGSYSAQLTNPIPPDTRLLEVRKDGSSAVVNLSRSFTEATNRTAALNVLVLSLTELRDSQGGRIFLQVVVQVEGASLSEFWGGEYAGPFARPALNG